VIGRAVAAKKTRRGLALGAVGLGACTLIAACSPVQAGSAAIVGNQRITSSSLDQQVSNLQVASKPLGSQITLTAAEQPRAVLTWLIRFSIMDQLAADNGISVSSAQSKTGLAEIQSQAASSASQEGFSSATALFLANGITPQMLPQLGTWVAQETAYELKANGGSAPTSTAQGNAVTAKYNKAECQAAKALNIQVSPQFGRLDYTQYTVVAATNTLSQPAGVPSPSSTTGLTPAC
jgi:peptidyl-prolyl cis-trans isomerase SurA